MKYGKAYLGDVLISDPNPDKPVKFYDYDGTIVKEYTLADAQALTSLPEAPQHEGLAFQGWNWTLEEIKAFGKGVDVGAIYTTGDDIARIYCTFDSEEWLRAYLTLDPATSGQLICIDWGDNSEITEITAAERAVLSHDYAASGSYIIRIYGEGSAARCRFYPDDISGQTAFSATCIKQIHCGDYFLGTSGTWNGFVALECATFANRTVGDNYFGSNFMRGCPRLAYFAFPRGYNSASSFQYCASLKVVSLCADIGEVSYIFQNCGPDRLVIPAKVTSLAISQSYIKAIILGDNTLLQTCTLLNMPQLKEFEVPPTVTAIPSFYNHSTLRKLVVRCDLPTIPYQFVQACYNLTELVLTTPPTTLTQGYNFREARSLGAIVLGEGLTRIPQYAFYGCISLHSLILPNTLTHIGTSAFNGCPRLTRVVIPESVTRIDNQAFALTAYDAAYSVAKRTFIMKGATPPTAGAAIFGTIDAALLEIRVPVESVAAYKSASGWMTYSSSIVPDVDEQ